MARALVIGASGGIGRSLVKELKIRGYAVTELSRSANGLDVTDESSVQKHISALEGPIDVVIVATGALASSENGPEKTLKALDPAAMAKQFSTNAIGPILVLKHILKLLPRNKRVVFAALSARVGSISDNELGGWYSYRASKAALNQYIRTASIELARSHKHSICIALHPGTVATQFTKNYQGHSMVEPDVAATNLLNIIESVTAKETGKFFDWAGKEIAW
ncbi:MAG: SDR family NAD(P)-dependent oxidoreductase [Pseudomonadota bacterium]